MADILLRDVPDDVAKALTKQAQLTDMTRGAYIRDLIVEMAKVRNDESAAQYIWTEIELIQSALSAIQAQFQPWADNNHTTRIKAEVQQPVQCLTLLLYLKSDLIHIADLLNKMNTTLKEQE